MILSTILRIGLLALALAACSASPTAPPGPIVTPTCAFELIPQATGEKYSELVMQATPPASAQPGQKIIIAFSQGYGLIGNYAMQCPDGTVMGYIHQDWLPNFPFEREVKFYLDEQPWTYLTCKQECRLEADLPANLTPGKHSIRFQLNSYFTPTVFEFTVP